MKVLKFIHSFVFIENPTCRVGLTTASPVVSPSSLVQEDNSHLFALKPEGSLCLRGLHSDIGFQLTQFPGKMAMERKGERVGAFEKFNILFTCLQIDQRGCTSTVEKGFVGSSMKPLWNQRAKLDSVFNSSKLSQVHTGDQSVLPTPRHSFVALSLPRSAQCPCL